ncbi:MAG TPA: hypothetical protein VGM39_25355 [Kofleriaceae bacterium]|jgi:predicted membrane-bound spermidine synthase
MGCVRCREDKPLDKRGWCVDCEKAFDGWVRRYAADILGCAAVGLVMVAFVALGLPWMGLPHTVALGGIFAGAGSIAGLYQLNARRRRKQFLLESMPRAYLPGKS